MGLNQKGREWPLGSKFIARHSLFMNWPQTWGIQCGPLAICYCTCLSRMYVGPHTREEVENGQYIIIQNIIVWSFWEHFVQMLQRMYNEKKGKKETYSILIGLNCKERNDVKLCILITWLWGCRVLQTSSLSVRTLCFNYFGRKGLSIIPHSVYPTSVDLHLVEKSVGFIIYSILIQYVTGFRLKVYVEIMCIPPFSV